jgi:hypothetical protein
MKKNIPFAAAALFFIMFCFGSAKGADILFDDFSTPHLDGARWWPREYVREVTDGQLKLELGNSTGMGAEVEPGKFRVFLPFAAPETLNAIEAQVTVSKAILDSVPGSASFIRRGGYFCNTGSAAAIGDVFAKIIIGDLGNGGLEVFWQVQEKLSESPPSTWDVLDSGTLISAGGVLADTAYRLKISFEKLIDNRGRLVFEADGHSAVYISPAPVLDPAGSGKYITAGIDADSGFDNGFISGKVDDVRVNNQTTVYDDFSLPLNFSNWESLEWVRTIDPSRQALKAQIQRTDRTGGARTYLARRDTSFIEARVRLNSDSVFSPGGWGEARLLGFFYNDSHGPGSGLDYNGYKGEVFADVSLHVYSDGIASKIWVGRSENADFSSETEVFRGTFSDPVYWNTDYLLSIRFIESKLIFKCNEQTIIFPIETPRYQPYVKYRRRLESKVYLDPGESGYMKAFYDDVRISDHDIVFCLQDYNFDQDMDGSDIYDFLADAKDVTLEQFAAHFGRTDCP